MMTPFRVVSPGGRGTAQFLVGRFLMIQGLLGQGLLGHGKHIARLFALVALLVMTFTVSTAQAEGNASDGAQKAYTCMGCHGVKHYVNTYPTYHVPKLAGQHQTYLIAALKAYRDGLRKHATMQANAGPLTDQDIEDIAAFFADQKN